MGYVRNIFFVVMLVGIDACTSVEEIKKPVWIEHPGNGVSASAGMHVRGRAAQEELAIMRARDEFAKRFGVTVRSEQALSTQVKNGRSSTVGSQTAQVGTNQADVKAVVKSKWLDPRSDEIWVWLVPGSE